MDKKLLTPGPLTTSSSTKEAMLHDWGSRDKTFIDLNHSIRESLVRLIDGDDDYQCVPMQGSGTFAVESMISSLTPKNSKILILINGAYGHRMKKMCNYLNRNFIDYEVAEDKTHDLNEIEKIIDSNTDLTHVFVVYCETTSGILNPIQEIADLIQRKNLSLFIDAMSAFGALPLSCKKLKFDAVAASSNKCLDVGTVNIWEVPGYRIEMSPFGGIKDSGLGYKEGVIEAMKSFTNVKTFSLPW